MPKVLGSPAFKGPYATRRKFLALAGIGAGLLASNMLCACTPPQDVSTNTTGRDNFKNLNLNDRPASEEELLDIKVNGIIESMSLEHKVSQLFIVRPEGLGGSPVTTQANDALYQALTKWPVGGFAYFEDNLIDATQTQTMLENTLQYSLDINGIPPFLCVDEEGGTVSRIGGTYGFDIANVGDMSSVGATGDPSYAKEVATIIASYLLTLGFNVDFAPVCDIANNPYSHTMRQRSFGSDANLVAQMAQAQIEGFLNQGLLPSAKHFPGIGAAVGDSHDMTITVERTLDELREVELVPFRAAIAAKAPFVMVGHLSLPLVVGDATPASISSIIVHQLLRNELGYEGIIITDSLEMGAAVLPPELGDSSVKALEAGCDIALMPLHLETAINNVLGAVESGVLTEERIDDSLRRVIKTKINYLGSHFA